MKKPIKRKKQKLIYIKWHDAYSSHHWHTSDELDEFLNKGYCICENVGWLIYEDKKDLILYSRRTAWEGKVNLDDHQVGLLQKIPKTWVLEQRILK
jgi:hypothetical protein